MKKHEHDKRLAQIMNEYPKATNDFQRVKLLQEARSLCEVSKLTLETAISDARENCEIIPDAELETFQKDIAEFEKYIGQIDSETYPMLDNALALEKVYLRDKVIPEAVIIIPE